MRAGLTSEQSAKRADQQLVEMELWDRHEGSGRGGKVGAEYQSGRGPSVKKD